MRIYPPLRWLWLPLLLTPLLLTADPRVSSLTLAGLGRTQPEVVIRALTVRVDSLADSTRLADDLERLQNLQLFSDVSQMLLADSSGGCVLHYDLVERFTLALYPILDWDEDRGWIWGAGLLNYNFRGWHEALEAEWHAGSEDGIYFEYRRPWFLGKRNTLALKLSRKSWVNLLEDLPQKRLQAQAGFAHTFNRYDSWGAYLQYIEMDITKPGGTVAPDGHDRFLELILMLGYNRYNLLLNPTRGTRVGMQWSLAGWDGQSPSFVTHDYRAGGVLPLLSWLRLTGGVRLIYNNGRVPVYRSRYTGGSWAVRSYPAGWQRGRNFFLSSVDIRFDILEQREIYPHLDVGLVGAVFFDAGRTWDEAFPGFDRLASGPGVELLCFLPLIGVARLDAGYNPARGVFTFHVSNQLRF